MMDTEIDRGLLEKIADLIGKPVGAFKHPQGLRL